MAMPDSGKAAKTALIGLVFVTLAYISTMFLRACPAILVLDLQESFQAGPAEVALFSSAVLLGYGLMQMPSGLITDAIGGRKAMTMFMGLAAMATLGFAYAPTLPLGVAARFVAGLCMAATPPMVAIIAYSVPASAYTRALGFCMAMGGAGFLLASEPLARLSTAMGWRNSLALVALIMGVLATGVFFTVKDGSQKTKAAATRKPVTLGGIGRNMLRVFKTKEFWPLALTQLCAMAACFSFMTMWAGPYLISAYGMTKVEASRLLFIQSLSPLVVIPLLSALADRLNSRKAVLVLSLCMGSLGGLGLALFAGQLGQTALVVCIMLFNASAGGCGTLVFALIARNFPREMTGTGSGCVNMFWPIATSVLNVLLGVLLKAKMETSLARDEIVELAVDNPVAANIAASAESYGALMLVLTGLWLIALIITVFFVKENFTVTSK